MVSIGQEISATNLQLALAYCSIANGGYLIKPHLIDKIYNNKETLYKKNISPLRKILSHKTCHKIIAAMEKTATHGTAKNIDIKGYKIAGKTGTAQKYINNSYSKDEFISSFASIFPSDNPKYVIVISVDSPNYGYHWANESAVPAAKEIIKKIIINDVDLNHKNQTLLASNYIIKNKTINYENKKYIQTDAENKTVPNLKGKTLKEALIISNELGLKLEPNKLSGKIIWQSIKPGNLINNNAICKIKLTI